MRKALAQLHRQAVVVAVDAVFVLRNGAVARVGARRSQIDRRGVGPHRRTVGVTDGVGHVDIAERGHIEIAHTAEQHAAAPDIGYGGGPIVADLALDGQRALLGVGGPRAGLHELNAGRAYAAVGRLSGEGVGKCGAGG